MKAERHDRVAEKLSSARDDFRAAAFDRAASACERLASHGDRGLAARATLLLARIELKRAPARALATLDSVRHVRVAAVCAETHLLAGVAQARLGRPARAASEFDAADAATTDREIAEEVTYQRAAAAWIERKLDRAEALLAKIREPRDPELRTQILVLRGAIASAREDLPAQGAILLDAARDARTRSDANVHHRAVVASQIASLAVELPSRELFATAESELDAIPWTHEIADLHFETLRSLAWRHVLEGDEFNAFRRLKRAVAVAPSAAWRVVALADRAYFATVLGESRWAAQELRDAHELAASIDWASVEGEEKLALPQLAELFAASDPTVAAAYVATFERVGRRYPRVLSSHSDRRVEAAEAYAVGCVRAALGERVRAKRSLGRAWTIYNGLGIAWRAARAAAAIARLDRSDLWSRRAEAGADVYPRSRLARPVRAASQPTAGTRASLDALTAAQRVVFDLLLEGLETQTIAERLGRSTFTVRNHIKAIFKACDVSSRPALIVRFARATLPPE